MKFLYIVLLAVLLCFESSVPSFSAENKEAINKRIAVHLAVHNIKWNKEVHIRPDCINCQNPSFTLIFNQNNAAELFKSILDSSPSVTTEGRIHALLGLYLLNDPEFLAYKNDFLNGEEKEDVATPEGKRLVKKDAKMFLDQLLETYSAEELTEALVIQKLPWGYIK